jgi:predicted GIY-YIG superfamily endonuclease
MFYAYVLKSKKDGESYISLTNNLRERLKQYNDGKIFFTKSRMFLD